MTHEYANGLSTWLYEQSDEKKLTPLELRNYVIEKISMFLDESEDYMEWVSPAYKQLRAKENASTSTYRLIMIILLIVSMILDVVGVVFMGSVSRDFLYVVRKLFVVAALFVTMLSFVVLIKRWDIQKFALLVIFGLLFESSMVSFLNNGKKMLIIGIIATCVRLLIMTFTALTLYRQFKTRFRERLYLKFLDSTWSQDISKLVTKVINICETAPNAPTRSNANAEIVRVITEVLEECSTESHHEADPSTQFDCDYVKIPVFRDDILDLKANSFVTVGCDGIPNGIYEASSRMYQLIISSVRNAIHYDNLRMTRIVIYILLFIICATTGNVAFEFWKIFANQPPNYSNELNEKYNDRERIRAEFGGGRSHKDLKVHVLVIDGLRDDFTEPGGSALGDYMDTPAFKQSSMKFHARAQLPSFSVPNWMSLLTGAFPEDTGVTGNLQNKETSFDNIYAIAKDYDVNAGITGTPWWAYLVASTLPPLGGDGTVDADYTPKGTPHYDWTTSDPADELRKEVALNAARRNTVKNPFGSSDNVTYFYELFLTHFSDVDAQGHAYGIDTKYNKRDTYRRAVANKTKALQEIINAIDNNTILIITSDHGHVMRGGHGGADDILRDIPLVFYKKDSTLGNRDAKYFKGSEEPLNRFKGKYSNLDISATICAILGLPSPRQSMGVFVEEAVDAFVPPQVQLQHYHDLLVAKVRAVQQYHEMMESTFFPGLTPTVFKDIDDPLLDKILKENCSYSHIYSDSVTKEEYTKLIKIVIQEYYKMRKVRNDGIFVRNFIISFFVFVPVIVVIGFIYHSATFVRIPALVNRAHPLHYINLYTCLCAIGSLLIYLLFSLVTYIVIYYGILGQTLWDSTATHTPAVAGEYLVAVIVGPVIYFTIITKAFLFRTIRWRAGEAITELRSLKRIRPSHILRWMYVHLIADMQLLLFPSRDYKPHQYLWAHLYIHYLCAWTVISSLVMLFICFPFSFILPGIFSVSHVSESILVYRFRLISILFIMLPMQCGCVVMAILRPNIITENEHLWDLTIVRSRLVGDLYCIETRIKDMKDHKEKNISRGDEGMEIVRKSEEIIKSYEESEKKIHLLVEWLRNPKYSPHIYNFKQGGSILFEL